jgi:hypothetical protein
MAERILAEFGNEAATVDAVQRLRAAGFATLEAYTPIPSHAVEQALGHRRSRLPLAIFVVGSSAAGGAYLLQWFLVGYLYPLVVGGRPPHFPLAFIIITFEMGILFAALTAFVGTLGLGRLVRLVDDVQDTPGFASVTRDAFWVEIAMTDRAQDRERTHELLRDAGALRIESAGGPR